MSLIHYIRFHRPDTKTTGLGQTQEQSSVTGNGYLRESGNGSYSNNVACSSVFIEDIVCIKNLTSVVSDLQCRVDKTAVKPQL